MFVMSYKVVVESESREGGVVYYDFRVENGEGENVYRHEGHHMTFNQSKKRDRRLVSLAMTRLEQEGLESYAVEDSSRQMIEDKVFEVVEE